MDFQYRKANISNIDILTSTRVKVCGIDYITLETTDMGKPLYERFGFLQMNDEMQLPK